MNNAIGGYFGLELRQGEHYHKEAIKLNTARNCLEYILRAKKYKKIYIPYYICEVILEPIIKLGVEYEFYSIDQNLNTKQEFLLKNKEVFLYTNYFGLKQNEVNRLVGVYRKQLIIDNSQAFYSRPIEGIDTFYSPRKFFGVADGGYLYTDRKLDIEFEQDCSRERMSHLLTRLDTSVELGYCDFRKNDDSLINQSIKIMSKLTNSILASINYEYIKIKRIENYKYLNSILGNQNKINLPLHENDVPMVYPFLNNDENLNNKLISNKIYVATYWPNVLSRCTKSTFEFKFSNNGSFLPIDQRYAKSEMDYIVKIING